MLNYEDRLRLSWTAEPDQNADRAAELDAGNQAVLHSVAAMETGVSTRLRDEQPELYHELERLGARLDVLMDLVGQLVSPDRHALEVRALVVAVDAIRFRLLPTESPPSGSGVLRVYLHAAVPQPLALAGRIERHIEATDGERWAEFRPDSLSKNLREALDQHVFRHHRRTIAERRRDGA